jgi:hypothetical protein
MNKEKDMEMSKVVSGEEVELLAIATTGGPAPAGDVVATVYKDSSALYVEPLPPQSLTCVKPVGAVGCPVARVWYGLANITPQQQADAEWFYGGPGLDHNWVLVVGHLATVTVRDHRTGDDPIEQTWFMVNKLYLTPFRRRIERHSTQFFYATGTTSNAQVLAISRGEQSPRAARITWTGMATYGGSSGPSSVQDMFVTGEADFTLSPLPVRADEYFVRQTRPRASPGPGPLPDSPISG